MKSLCAYVESLFEQNSPGGVILQTNIDNLWSSLQFLLVLQVRLRSWT